MRVAAVVLILLGLAATWSWTPLAKWISIDTVDAWAKYLRENAPVHQDEQGTYILTRYDDVYTALQDPKTFSSHMELSRSEIDVANQRLLVYVDDPEHLGLRKLVNRAWTPSAVLELEPVIERHMADLMVDVEPERPFDILPMGTMLALHCFADAMAVPYEQHMRVRAWATAAGMFTTT